MRANTARSAATSSLRATCAKLAELPSPTIGRRSPVDGIARVIRLDVPASAASSARGATAIVPAAAACCSHARRVVMVRLLRVGSARGARARWARPSHTPSAIHTIASGTANDASAASPMPRRASSPSVCAPSDVAGAVDEGVDERLRLVAVGARDDGEQRFARRPHDAALHGAKRGVERDQHRQRSGDRQTEEAERRGQRQQRQRHRDAEPLHQLTGDQRLQQQRRCLRDHVDARERRRARVEVARQCGDHLQAREVDEGGHHRDDQHIGADARAGRVSAPLPAIPPRRCRR